MKISAILTAMSFLAFTGLISASALEIGAPTPAVTSVDENGQPVRFIELCRTGLVLVYFYPKADTPGCTAQACSLRDSFGSLQTRGVRIVGVSADKPGSQKKFREKHGLQFSLVADASGDVAKAFGVPTFLGFTKRQSFLLRDGKLVWRDLSVSPKSHVATVNQAVDALK